MDEKIGVRDAEAGDADGIVALATALADVVGDARPDPGPVQRRLEELLEEPRARVFVAEDGESIVGVVTLWVKPDLAHGDTVVEVPMLAVAEGSRRNGVGRLLVQRVRALAAKEGASLVELVATSANTVAREFYRSMGFVEADLVALEFVGDLKDPPDPRE